MRSVLVSTSVPMAMMHNRAMIKNVFLVIFICMPVSYLAVSPSLVRLSDQPKAKDQYTRLA
jgi:hypothetical protein